MQVCDNLTEQKKAIEKNIVAYQIKINQYAKGVRDLYLDKVKGIVSESDYIELFQDFTSQKERFETQASDLRKRLAEIEAEMARGNDRRALIKQYVNTKHLTRTMVEIFIDKILVGKRIDGTRTNPIIIHWNF